MEAGLSCSRIRMASAAGVLGFATTGHANLPAPEGRGALVDGPRTSGAIISVRRDPDAGAHR